MASNEVIPMESQSNVPEQTEMAKHLWLMLSYNHDYERKREVVHRIKDKLRDYGYNVWIDKEKMFKSTTEMMVKAVKDANIVLICWSREYDKSENCQFECKHIEEFKKPFIVLKMEDYKIDEASYVKQLMKDDLYVKFTDEDFDKNFQELLRYLIRLQEEQLRKKSDPMQGIEKMDYRTMISTVAQWWKKNGDIDMLKVLLVQFESVVRVDIEDETDVERLLNLLTSSGESTRKDVIVIFELVQICGLAGVKSEIEKIEAFKGFNFQTLEIKHFTPFRQKLIKFGKILGVQSVKRIAYLYEIDVAKKKVSPWLLIWELEGNGHIEEGNKEIMTKFITVLRQNGLNREADIIV